MSVVPILIPGNAPGSGIPSGQVIVTPPATTVPVICLPGVPNPPTCPPSATVVVTLRNKGDKGDQGDFGTALTVAAEENLPLAGQFIGQFYRVGVVVPYVWYRWSGSEWERLVARSELPFFGTLEELKAVLKEYFDDLYWNVPLPPAGAYLTPSGDDGYYNQEGEFYTSPQN